MAQTYVAATKFTAIDKFSSVVNKMNKSTASLGGTLAQLGGIVGGLAIGQQIADANLQAEKSFASLSAVTGLSGKAFDTFKVAAEQTANATGMLIGDTAKAMELIGSQKPELLASASAMQQVTEAAITLSRASGEDLTASAGNLTGIMNQFNLGAETASNSINVLAAGTVAGAASIAEVAESLKNVGTVASMSNMSLETTVATLQALSLKKITGAEAGTKLRGVLLNLKDAGLGYASGQFKMNDALLDAQKKMATLKTAKEKDAYASKIFGKENINAGLIMIDSIKTINDMTKQVTGTTAATDMAAKNFNTLANGVISLKNKFMNFFTATGEGNKTLEILKKSLKFVSENMVTIIKIVGIAIGIWLAYRAVLIANTVYVTLMSVALGINAAVTNASAFAVYGNTIAYTAFRTVIIATTAAQWLWNSALAVGLLPLLAIAAAIGAVVYLGYRLIQNFDEIQRSFKVDGILAGFKAIGAVILDSVLSPVQSLLQLIAKIPGMAKMMQPAIDQMKKMRGAIGINPETGELMDIVSRDNTQTNNLNPDASNASVMSSYKETVSKQNMTIFVKPVDGASATTSGMKDINAKVSPTLGTSR